MLPAGRFAPSPTGHLHLGNLRTALIAWLSARTRGLQFLIRMEDLDPVTSSSAHQAAQLAALAAIGLDWDGEVVCQSDRFAVHDAAVDLLTTDGRTYECFCTRREIRDAAHAPNGEVSADGAYPGTCRDLTDAECRSRRERGRRPAIRLRGGDELVTVEDDLCGVTRGRVDDVVLRRNDGVPAYNLAVVVDDALQGVSEVVRGDDLLSSTPRQVLLQRLLGLPTPRYLHVPLVLGADHVRLAKRHGAITLDQLAAMGLDSGRVVSLLAASLGRADAGDVRTATELLERFDPRCVPRKPWILPVDLRQFAAM